MLHRIAYNLMFADWHYRRALVPLDRQRALLRPAPVLPALTRLLVREAAGELSPALYPGLVLHDEGGYTAIFAQRTEKVKVRMSGSAGPSRPLRRGPRHDGSSVRKVYFLHFAAPWPHLVRVSRGIRADTVAKIIMRLACRGAGFLHSAVVTQDEGQEAHPLGAFYLFGALGKNNLSVSKPLRCRETGVLRRLLRLVNRCVSQSVPCETTFLAQWFRDEPIA